ncbi:MAG: type II toxin-antitoxin system ParD family antitoxin [Bosea sp.]|uniref:type II toxin-antitoxin system ParD family antitoxin n=1 Tax=Bosea sp. (in: a-proteobacteria) TaxID=1871050 RepID=UPI002386ED1A|nr:type II toxin-antitoxin system ParD family antitoxin [Bosea sp. (in: a-proteobacteria)]MCP4733494.1 type II toxin-antitoxin system ParD family antitoxin [Bosea sp. (in: a-proteobacteria)]
MRTTQSLSITLPHEMAQMVKSKVASGEYASESEVVRDGLRVLAARDQAVDNWLREEVLPIYDEIAADPSKAVSAEEAWAQIEAHIGSRKSGA